MKLAFPGTVKNGVRSLCKVVRHLLTTRFPHNTQVPITVFRAQELAPLVFCCWKTCSGPQLDLHKVDAPTEQLLAGGSLIAGRVHPLKAGCAKWEMGRTGSQVPPSQRVFLRPLLPLAPSLPRSLPRTAAKCHHPHLRKPGSSCCSPEGMYTYQHGQRDQ